MINKQEEKQNLNRKEQITGKEIIKQTNKQSHKQINKQKTQILINISD